ncbi:MAG: hypothetical protein JSW20_14170 [Nitrospiraceae bacterium]|nr:MAG: hypothetical protein JSW20_14170 [Nitrospiraceae bacterium]
MIFSRIRLLAVIAICIISAFLVSSCREPHSPVAAVDPISEADIFEDHSEALVSWMKKGHKDEVLVHVDHHSDCQYVPDHKILSLKKLYENREWDEILKHKDSGGVLFSLADFIYPAYRLGIVKKVYWVTTLDLFWSNNPLPVVQAYLRENKYSDDVIDSFHIDGKKATGSVHGLEVTISTLDDLPPIQEPVMLSIDIDYFSNIMKESKINELKVIKDFLRILRHKKLKIKNLDITYSVNGGYTAILDRHIGDELVQIFRHPEIVTSWKFPVLWRIRDVGFNLIRNDRVDDADKYFDTYLTHYPDEPTLLLGKAMCLSYKGKDTDSFNVIEKLLKNNPEYDPVYIYMSKAFKARGESWKVKLYVYEYLKRHPELYFQKEHFMKPDDNDRH